MRETNMVKRKECEYPFCRKTAKYYNKHYMVLFCFEHFNDMLFYCPICEFAFEDWNDYVKHRKEGCKDYGIIRLIKSKCEYLN